jgi:hypothetical protein
VGEKVQLLLTIDLYNRGSEGSGSRPCHDLPPGKNHRYPLDRRLGGFKAGLNREARGKIRFLCRGSNPVCPVCSQSSQLLAFGKHLTKRIKLL